MIGILLLGQKNVVRGLIEAVEHTLGSRPERLNAVGIDYDRSPEEMEAEIKRAIEKTDGGEGVLILADIYGATHTNLACRTVNPGRIELVAGASLPMLLRALNYRNLPMTGLVAKATSGGADGIVCARASDPRGAARK